MDSSSFSGFAATFIITALVITSGLSFSSLTSVGEIQGNTPGTRTFPEGFSASICTWKDDKNGALSVTFDDGLNSHVVNASPIMSLLDLNGTFFVTIDNVGISYGATWAEWQTVADSGHEIASHSKSHPDLRILDPDQLYEEVVMSKSYIEANLTDVRCQTFSYPMGLYNETVMDLVRQNYISARQDRHNITAQPGPSPISPSDMYSIIPVEFGTGETASELNGLVEDTISSGGWLVEMIHAVGSGGYDPVDLGQFSSHMQYIANSRDDVWISTFGDVSKYIRVRDLARINMTHPEDHLLDIVLETTLNEIDFDIPITVNVSVPSDWIDLDIYRGPVPTLHHTESFGDHRYTIIELRASERIRIVQTNRNPSIEIFEAISGSGAPFSPLSGDSLQFYWFYLNYTSVVNRPPLGRPMVWLDLNGDGDLDDTVNEHPEGRLEMSKVEMSDSDYTDGCIYFIEEMFPSGTHLKIRFSSLDSEELEAVSSTGMGDWMDGPILNDPPFIDFPPFIMSNHTKRPTFYWEEGSDPDGDPIQYRISLSYLRNGTEIFTYDVASTNFTSDRSLMFFTEYNFSISAHDGRGLNSAILDLHFNLTNKPPPKANDVSIGYRKRLIPVFKIDAPPDPDGDWVSYNIAVQELTNGDPVTIYTDQQTVNNTFITDLELKDHTNYTVSVWQRDLWTEGEYFSKEFYCNFPPLPIFGGEVKDLQNEEDGAIVSWYASQEDDVASYRIFKFLHEPQDLYPDQASEIFEIEDGSFIYDRNVTDGSTYWYAVIAVDMDGEFDTGNVTIFNGTPLDDVAPLPITDIKVTFQEKNENYTDRMMIEWDQTDDERFLGYRIYRTTRSIEDISGMPPIFYHNGTSNKTSIWDFDIEVNMTYYYTVTAVDLNGNELLSGLSWTSSKYPYVPPPYIPPKGDDDGDDWDSQRKMYVGIFIAVILILLIGISYLSFMLMQSKTHYYDEPEE